MMGLDIAFNRELAIKAGIEVAMIPNQGTYAEGDDPEYIAWCNHVEECIKVPGTDHYLRNGGGEEDFVVRANMWGSSYEPLTEWLKSNKIDWSEF